MGDGTVIALPPGQTGKEISELGVRPEALTVTSEQGDTTGTVSVVERLGDRTLLYVKLRDGTQVTAQDRGVSAVQPGATVSLLFDRSGLHLFASDGSAWLPT
jgi:multiple sugar transport system ATP-binding protein